MKATNCAVVLLALLALETAIGEQINPTVSDEWFSYDVGGGPLGFLVGATVGAVTAGMLSSLPSTKTYKCVHEGPHAADSGPPGASTAGSGPR